ncbi:hypothetical protein [Streptomyces sp. NPDC005955]|uniref:hypothetical protein n=1 Tax=Streptomyces sp. NPDC005955 TaxID=3364738 RepID=UPI0036CAA130
MRLRTAVVTAAAASLTLLLAVPGPAAAASGDFTYRFRGPDGQPQPAVLHDPPSGECLTLSEVADPASSPPAFAPWNNTDEWATVFQGPRCTGDTWDLRPHGRPATDRLELRSVVFWR